MVVLPMLNGGRIENRWQPMSQLMCSGPSSRCSSFMAVKIGRSGQPVQKPGGRGGNRLASACTSLDGSRSALARRAPPPARRAALEQRRAHSAAGMTRGRAASTCPVYSPARGSTSLPTTLVGSRPGAGSVEALLDELRLPLLDDQHRALARAERDHLLVDQRIGDVEHVERQRRIAERIGEAEQLERAQQRVVQAALQDDADIAASRRP